MSEFESEEHGPVERLLREQRSELSALELDRVKQRAMAGAERRGGKKMSGRSRLVTALLVCGLVGTSGGAVIAASGGSSSSGSSANSQYCPPSSPGAGKPKKEPGGNKCGHPEGGDPGNGNGNGGGNGNGNNGNGNGNGGSNGPKPKQK